MGSDQADRFQGRRFPEAIIVLCVRCYLRYCLSYRDLEEMMAKRGVEVDHSMIARWVLHFSPILKDRIRREMRRPNRSWRVDETCQHTLRSALWPESFELRPLFAYDCRVGINRRAAEIEIAMAIRDANNAISSTTLGQLCAPVSSH
jgi:hypothetical protein